MNALLELFALIVGRELAEKGTDAPAEAIAIIRSAHQAVEDARADPARLQDSMAKLRAYAGNRAAGLDAARDLLAKRFPSDG